MGSADDLTDARDAFLNSVDNLDLIKGAAPPEARARSEAQGRALDEIAAQLGYGRTWELTACVHALVNRAGAQKATALLALLVAGAP